MIRAVAAAAIVILAGVPISAMPDMIIVPIELLAAGLCGLGLFWPSLGSVGVGAWLAMIGYAIALLLSGDGLNIFSAVLFGLALLFLFELSEFARRFDGAEIEPAALRAQGVCWLGRAAVACAAIALLLLGGSVLAPLVAGAGRAVATGIGAAIAFAAALYAIGRQLTHDDL